MMDNKKVMIKVIINLIIIKLIINLIIIKVIINLMIIKVIMIIIEIIIKIKMYIEVITDSIKGQYHLYINKTL